MNERKQSIWTKNLLHTPVGVFIAAYVFPIIGIAFGLYGIIKERITLRGYTYEGIDAVVLGTGIIFCALAYTLQFTLSKQMEGKKRYIPMISFYSIFIACLSFSLYRNI